MAVLSGSAADEEVLPTGIFGPLARAQYAALAQLRWRILVNGVRSTIGAFEVGARAVSYLAYAVMALGIGFGVGALTFELCSRQKWQYLPLVFWAVFVLWQMLPIMLASFQEQFDLGTLLRFPVSFRSYYLLYVLFGLSDISALDGGVSCLAILIGVGLARPDLLLITALVLLVFAAFNVLLTRVIFAWIDRWLSQRRTREILGALFMLFFLSFQLLNPAIWQHGHSGPGHGRRQPQQFRQLANEPWVQTALQVQQWLPPGLAAASLTGAAESQPTDPQQSVSSLGPFARLGFLAVFAIATGAALGLRLRAEFRGENLGGAPARIKSAAVRGKSAGRAKTVAFARAEPIASDLLGDSSPIPAIVAKEFRALMRTLPLLYAIGAPLLMVLVVAGSFARQGPLGQVPSFAFPLCIFFAQLGLTQFFANSFGVEGAGVQIYFLSPTPMRTVLLGKNLFHLLLFLFSVSVAATLTVMRMGWPSGTTLAFTVAWLMFALPGNLAAGNILSLIMPNRINPGRIGRQGRSQASSLLSLAVQAGQLVIGALAYAAGSFSGLPWLPIPILLFLAVVAVFAWLRVLRSADGIAARHKDQLIATLAKLSF
jgi:ABC-2 type transport system permease protein